MTPFQRSLDHVAAPGDPHIPYICGYGPLGHPGDIQYQTPEAVRPRVLNRGIQRSQRSRLGQPGVRGPQNGQFWSRMVQNTRNLACRR